MQLSSFDKIWIASVGISFTFFTILYVIGIFGKATSAKEVLPVHWYHLFVAIYYHRTFVFAIWNFAQSRNACLWHIYKLLPIVYISCWQTAPHVVYWIRWAVIPRPLSLFSFYPHRKTERPNRSVFLLLTAFKFQFIAPKARPFPRGEGGPEGVGRGTRETHLDTVQC